jgi:hypothetical protein
LESFISSVVSSLATGGDTFAQVPEITIHESIDDAGAPIRTRLSFEDQSLALSVGEESFALPDGALEAVMKRYGKPLDAAESEMMIDARLELGDGRALVRFRFMCRYDVIARDYLVLYAPGAEPLCEMATAVAAALEHLARRFSAPSGA